MGKFGGAGGEAAALEDGLDPVDPEHLPSGKIDHANRSDPRTEFESGGGDLRLGLHAVIVRQSPWRFADGLR